MPETCENIKAQLTGTHKGLTALAQLVAVYTSAGIISVAEISNLTGYSERAIRKAKTELGCRNPGADGTRVPEPECRERNLGAVAEPGCRNPGADLARAYKESSTKIDLKLEDKNISSVPAETEHTQTPKTRAAKRRFSYTDEFLAFWAAFPSIGNSSKRKSFDSWMRLLPAERTLALDGLTHLAAHCRKNPTYTCMHVTTYLNEMRWEAYETPAQRLAPKAAAEPEWIKRKRLEDEVLAVNGIQ